VVTVPRALPRLVPLPSEKGCFDFILLHKLIESQVERMFRGYQVLSRAAFRVTRNSNLYLQEEESRRCWRASARSCTTGARATPCAWRSSRRPRRRLWNGCAPTSSWIRWQVFRTDGPVNLSRLMTLPGLVRRPELKYTRVPWTPLPAGAQVGEPVRRAAHARHSAAPPLRLVLHGGGVHRVGGEGPAVISMKQTLYRTSDDSPLFKALTEAAQSKEVTVVVELMARFDEASNIRWAREMEDAGVGVFLGILGLKTHCKLALMVRRDPDGVVRRYAHLGTGNYNSVTARLYTDISLLTARPEITSAVQSVFRYLTAESEDESYAPLLVAPLTLAQALLELIGRETAHARREGPPRLWPR
jgi:polyphosphate kinase